MIDQLVPLVMWCAWGIGIGGDAYAAMRDLLPWPHRFRANTRARIIVLSIAAGVCWPAAILLDELRRFRLVARWATALITWRRPRDVP